jgi:hypothetical protein
MVQLNIRVAGEEKAAFEVAAAKAGQTLSGWIRATLLCEARPPVRLPEPSGELPVDKMPEKAQSRAVPEIFPEPLGATKAQEVVRAESPIQEQSCSGTSEYWGYDPVLKQNALIQCGCSPVAQVPTRTVQPVTFVALCLAGREMRCAACNKSARIGAVVPQRCKACEMTPSSQNAINASSSRPIDVGVESTVT